MTNKLRSQSQQMLPSHQGTRGCSSQGSMPSTKVHMVCKPKTPRRAWLWEAAHRPLLLFVFYVTLRYRKEAQIGKNVLPLSPILFQFSLLTRCLACTRCDSSSDYKLDRHVRARRGVTCTKLRAWRLVQVGTNHASSNICVRVCLWPNAMAKTQPTYLQRIKSHLLY